MLYDKAYFKTFDSLGVCDTTLALFKKDNSNHFRKDYLFYPFEFLTHPLFIERTRRFFFEELQLFYGLSSSCVSVPRERKVTNNHKRAFEPKWIQRCVEFFLHIKEHYPDLYRPIYKNMVYEMSHGRGQYWPHMLAHVLIAMRMYHPSDDFPLADDMFTAVMNKHDITEMKSYLTIEHQAVIAGLVDINHVLNEPLRFIDWMRQAQHHHISYESAELYF